ncbi:MAG: hypothetical protein ACJAQS_001959 [Porticoccus sp.]|jgi:hypothetical protein
MDYLSSKLKLFTILTCIGFVVGCYHPLEIEGQGDIVSSTGERNCSIAAQPCDNLVVFDYVETYTAVPKAGNQFVGWEGCGDQHPLCSYNIPATTVRKQWFKTMPSLKAIFSENPMPDKPTGLVVARDHNRLNVSWDSMATASSYDLYYANESFGRPIVTSNYASLNGGLMVSGISNNNYEIANNVDANDEYYILVVANSVNGTSAPSREKKITALEALNDTGMVQGGISPSGLGASCIGDVIEAQDCNHGRDDIYNDDRDGNAGFSFTKLDPYGSALPSDAVAWDCVQDNVTGLAWEVKTIDGGLHDGGDLYTWYDSNNLTNGGSSGYEDEEGDVCNNYDMTNTVTFCNTEAFVARVNDRGLCGRDDWRVPSLKEIATIIDRSKSIDARFFPNITFGRYWSSTPTVFNDKYAWAVTLTSGPVEDSDRFRAEGQSVILVHGGGVDLLNDTSDSRYNVNDDGTVEDTFTKLMWRQCVEGLSGNDCSQGSVVLYNWQQALQLSVSESAAGYDDWRVPNVEELRSLVAYDRYNPAININIFPNTPRGGALTSTPDIASNPRGVRSVIFQHGFTGYYSGRANMESLRLVRDIEEN